MLGRLDSGVGCTEQMVSRCVLYSYKQTIHLLCPRTSLPLPVWTWYSLDFRTPSSHRGTCDVVSCELSCESEQHINVCPSRGQSEVFFSKCIFSSGPSPVDEQQLYPIHMNVPGEGRGREACKDAQRWGPRHPKLKGTAA